MTEATGWRWVPEEPTPLAINALAAALGVRAKEARCAYDTVLSWAAHPSNSSAPEPSEDAVERAARAIYELTSQKLRQVNQNLPAFVEATGTEKARCRELARAALSASAPQGGEHHLTHEEQQVMHGALMRSVEVIASAPPAPPADFELCHCELSSEVQVIRAGETGCELCDPAKRIKPDADAVEGVLKDYQRRCSAAPADELEAAVQEAIDRFDAPGLSGGNWYDVTKGLREALARHRAQPSDCTAEEMKERAVKIINSLCMTAGPLQYRVLDQARAGIRNLSTKE